MLRVYKSLKYLSHVSNNLNEYTLYAVEDASQHMQSSKPTEVQLHVDGQPLSMKVDIGVSWTLVSKSTFDCLWPDRELQPTTVQLPLVQLLQYPTVHSFFSSPPSTSQTCPSQVSSPVYSFSLPCTSPYSHLKLVSTSNFALPIASSFLVSSSSCSPSARSLSDSELKLVSRMSILLSNASTFLVSSSSYSTSESQHSRLAILAHVLLTKLHV